MIKFYCDRCGKEVNKLYDIGIPESKGSFSFKNKTIQGCLSCKGEADNINDKLVDIRFLLFKDFMPGGAE